jgi:hypothetical protein
VGKRSRQRGRRGANELRAPTAAYEHASFGVLELRGALSPGTRRDYAELPARTREDAWQRAVEFLFERLAARWTVAGVAYERQAELLARYRMASPDERAWIRDILREHVAGHFPDIEAP